MNHSRTKYCFVALFGTKIINSQNEQSCLLKLSHNTINSLFIERLSKYDICRSIIAFNSVEQSLETGIAADTLVHNCMTPYVVLYFPIQNPRVSLIVFFWSWQPQSQRWLLDLFIQLRALVVFLLVMFKFKKPLSTFT